MEPFAILFMCAGFIGLYFLRFRVGFPSSYSLLPFQSGILYRRGIPVRVVSPGRHRVFLGREKIVFLDTRPIEVKVESRAVGLVDGATAFYGFAASARVHDVQKAIHASGSYSELPAFVTLCVAREVLGRCNAEEVKLEQMRLNDEIRNRCSSRLAEAGFELLSFGFTGVSVVSRTEM